MKSKTGKILTIIGGSIAGVIVLIIALVIVANMSEGTKSYPYNTGGGYYYEKTPGDYYQESGQYSNAVYEAEKVITRNRISIETNSIAKTLSKVEALINTYEGKIISKNIDLGDSRYGSIVVKIPSDKGNEFVDKLNKDYDVSSYTTDVSDVTETYVNTEQEIGNLQRKIKLYEELAAQTSIKEIDLRIQIIDKIFALERQIEYLKESNESIDKKTLYRDVTITLSAPEKIQGERNYWHNTVQMIVSTLQGSFRVLIVLITLAIPFVLLIGLPIISYRKTKKKRVNGNK